MMGDELYYKPEKVGLVEIYECDLGGSYEFDKFVVWLKPETNEIYWAYDSGCSCPSPFETTEWPEDFHFTTVKQLDPIERSFREWLKDQYEDTSNINVTEVMQQIRYDIHTWWLEQA